MAKKVKPQRITFGSIFRLIIFSLIIFILISWFSQKSSDKVTNNDPTLFIGETSSSSNVLGDMYSKLPQDSRQQLENFDQTQVGEFVSNATKYIKNKLDGFPQKQIKEIKKGIIKNISDDMIKTIEMLAGSQGFYGRLLNGLREADKDDVEAFWQEADARDVGVTEVRGIPGMAALSFAAKASPVASAHTIGIAARLMDKTRLEIATTRFMRFFLNVDIKMGLTPWMVLMMQSLQTRSRHMGINLCTG